MTKTDRERLLTMVQARGTVTAGEAARAGIHSQQLTRLVAEGTLERFSPGHYRLVSGEASEHHGLVLAAAAAPRAVVCLLSALAFHGIGTQVPGRVWLAIERGTRPPRLAFPPLHVVRFSGPAFSTGIETHRAEEQRLRVYSVAKTLADLFKYRNRIGLDVALEALQEAWRDRRFTMDDLEEAARACRVARVMRPYLEGLVA